MTIQQLINSERKLKFLSNIYKCFFHAWSSEQARYPWDILYYMFAIREMMKKSERSFHSGLVFGIRKWAKRREKNNIGTDAQTDYLIQKKDDDICLLVQKNCENQCQFRMQIG